MPENKFKKRKNGQIKIKESQDGKVLYQALITRRGHKYDCCFDTADDAQKYMDDINEKNKNGDLVKQSVDKFIHDTTIYEINEKITDIKDNIFKILSKLYESK